MWAVIKRLALGAFLIGLASAVLLVSDRGRRKPGDDAPGTTRIDDGKQSAAPPAAPAQPASGRMYKVGIVYFAPEPGVEECMRGLVDGFRDAGFVEGRNLEIRKSHAQGEIANIPPLFQNYDTQGLDLIIPMTTPCLTAACGTVKHTPVVFTYVYDPIAAGAGTDFSHHLPNVTGVGSFPPVADTVDLIRQLMPGVKIIGTLYNSSEANSRKVVEVARRDVTQRGMQLEEVTVINASEVFQAAQAVTARDVQALWITGDNTAIQGFDAIVKVANDARLPLITNDVEPVAKASLATVGIGFYQPGYAAARLAARVLLGAKPADIAIENVAVNTVALNLLVARKLGIPLSDEGLQRADVLIDETGVHERSTAASAPPTRRPGAAREDLEDRHPGVRQRARRRGRREGHPGGAARCRSGRRPRLSGTGAQRAGRHADAQGAGRRRRQRRHGSADDVLDPDAAGGDATRHATSPSCSPSSPMPSSAGAGRSNDDHLPNVTGVPTTSRVRRPDRDGAECLPTARRRGHAVRTGRSELGLQQGPADSGGDAATASRSSRWPRTPVRRCRMPPRRCCNQPLDAVVQIGGQPDHRGLRQHRASGARAQVPVVRFAQQRLPSGAAVVVARDYFDGGREAGMMAARIMRGESPAAIPFQPLKKTKTLINLEAARPPGSRSREPWC